MWLRISFRTLQLAALIALLMSVAGCSAAQLEFKATELELGAPSIMPNGTGPNSSRMPAITSPRSLPVGPSTAYARGCDPDWDKVLVNGVEQ